MSEPSRTCWICYSAEPYSSYYDPYPQSIISWYRSWYRNVSRTLGQNTQGEWLNPCPCKGSMRWVHHSCLVEWTRVQFANLHQHSFTHVFSVPRPTSLLGRIWQRIRRSLPSWIVGQEPIDYLVHEKLCCPQCKTPYHFYEIPASWLHRLMEYLVSLGEKTLVLASISGLFFSIYSWMWLYGYFSLRCLVGSADLQPVISFQFPSTVPEIRSRQSIFTWSVIPLFPVSLVLCSNPISSQMSLFLLHYFAHLYQPVTWTLSSLDEPDGAQIDPSFIMTAWILPASWALYCYVHRALVRHLFPFGISQSREETPLTYQDSEDAESDNLFGVEQATVSDSDQPSDYGASSPVVQRSASSLLDEYMINPEEPTRREPVGQRGTGASSVRINVLTTMRIFTWPFAAALGGKALSWLAMEHRIMPFILSFSMLARNTLAGLVLVVARDLGMILFGYLKMQRLRSRVILPWSTEASK